MILVDANVLLNAYDSSAQFHRPCRRWFERALNGRSHVGLPTISVLAFMRLGTNRRILATPFESHEACSIVNSWFARSNVRQIDAGPRFWQLLEQLLQQARASGPLVTDAAIAAHALENGAAVCTLDRDFRRFDGIELVDPTAE
jgi:hypothetical protein